MKLGDHPKLLFLAYQSGTEFYWKAVPVNMKYMIVVNLVFEAELKLCVAKGINEEIQA